MVCGIKPLVERPKVLRHVIFGHGRGRFLLLNLTREVLQSLSNQVVLLSKLLRQLSLSLFILIQFLDHQLDQTAHVVRLLVFFFRVCFLRCCFILHFLVVCLVIDINMLGLAIVTLGGCCYDGEVQGRLGAALHLQLVQLAVYAR